MTIRILVIDDHPMVRAGVRSELENSGADLEIVGDAADVEGAIAACHALTPDVALLDVHLPGACVFPVPEIPLNTTLATDAISMAQQITYTEGTDSVMSAASLV